MSDTPQRPTPETDAEASRFPDDGSRAECFWVGFARTLERQRDEAVEALKRYEIADRWRLESAEWRYVPDGTVPDPCYNPHEIAERALARIQAIGTKGGE